MAADRDSSACGCVCTADKPTMQTADALTIASAIQLAAVVDPLKATTTFLVFQANSTLSSLSSSKIT
jgi:hypothetical protein